MKFKFSLKDKEVSMEADVEKLVEKGMDHKVARPDKKNEIPNQARREKKKCRVKA